MIDPLQVNNLKSNDNAEKFLQAQQYKNLQALHSHAFTAKYFMNEQQFELLAKYMHPRPVMYDTKLSHCEHPVAASLQQYAYQQCVNIAKKYPKSIDFGGTPLRTPKGTHLCTLINDVKTDARYTEAALNQLLSSDEIHTYDMRSYLMDKHEHCINGAAYCQYKAKYGFAVNVYDIDFKEIPVIFIQHGLYILDMWMFLPTSLMDHHFERDKDLYTVKYKGDRAYFTLKDQCDMYIHDHKNWRKYLTTVAIQCSDFAINIEHRETLGSFTHIRFTRTQRTAITKMRHLPYSDIPEVIIPDVIRYMTRGDFTQNPFKHVFRVPREYLARLTNWATACTDTSFNYNSFATYATACASDIKFHNSNKILMTHEGFKPTYMEFESIKQSIFIVLAKDRFLRTKNIQQAYKKIKDSYCSNIFSKLVESIKQYFTQVFYDFILQFSTDDNKHFSDTLYHILDLKFKYPQDFYVIGRLKGNLSANDNIRLISIKNLDSRPKFEETPEIATVTTNVSQETQTEEPDNVSLKSMSLDSYLSTSQESIDSTHVTFSDQVAKFNITRHMHLVNDGPMTSTCYDVVYDPIGDGKCGLHALRFIAMQMYNKEIVVPIIRCYQYNGIPRTLPRDWYDDYDLAYVAIHNKLPIKIHQNGTLISYVLGGMSKYGIDNQNGHWRVVSCVCNTEGPIISDYADLPITSEYLYVNCAHDNLIDGAGQAKTFAAMFPGYKNGWFKKGDRLPANPHIIRHTHGDIPVHLCIAVAHRNSKNRYNVEQSHIKLHEIFDSMQNYCNTHHLVAFLPLIGCGLFNGEMACFKAVLSQYSFRHRIVFIDKNQEIRYNGTPCCTHGGYKVVLQSHDIVKINQNAHENDDHYDYQRLPEQYPQLHTGKKLEEALSYIHREVNKKTFKSIYDFTAAPGYFLDRFMDTTNELPSISRDTDYFAFTYDGPNSLKMKNRKYNVRYYSNISSIKVTPEDSLVIFDFYPTLDNLKYLLQTTFAVPMVNQSRNVLLFKIDVCENMHYDALDYIKNNRLHWSLVQFDNSPPKSYEGYVVVTRQADNTKTTKAIKATDIIRNFTINKVNRELPKCVCDHAGIADKPNCNVTWTVSDETKMLAYNSILESIKLIDKEFTIDELLRIPITTKDVTIPVIAGVAGCSKTSYFIRNTCPRCCTLVTPYRTTCEQSRAQKTIASTQFTYIYDILRGKREPKKYLYLDEIFTMSAVYIKIVIALHKDTIIIGGGDQYQIDYRNYSGNDERYEIEKITGKEYILVSNRILPAVAKILQKYIPDITTTNKNGSPIIHKEVDEIYKVDKEDHQIMCFTQKTKDQLSKKLPQHNVNTVNSSQGITVPYADLYVGDLINISSEKIRYIYTGVSRCTTQLVLYGNTSQIEEFYKILQTPIENVLNSFNITPVDTIVIEKPTPIEHKHTTMTTIDTMQATIEGVDEILKKIYIPANETRSNIIAYKTDIAAPVVNGANVKFSEAYFASTTEQVSGKRIGNNNYILHHSNANQDQKRDTAITRYTKEGKHLPKEMVKRYIDGFDKFTKPGWRDAFREEFRQISKFRYVADYLKKLQTKYSADKEYVRFFTEVDDPIEGNITWFDMVLTADPTERKDIAEKYGYAKDSIRDFLAMCVTHSQISERVLDAFNAATKRGRKTLLHAKFFAENFKNKINDLQKEWTESYHNLIQFHLKTQTKEVRSPGWDTSYKAGQGISAWSKLLNVLFSYFTRAYSDLIPKYLLDNVVLAYGESDARLQEKFQPHAKIFNARNIQKMTADFTEFDSSQDEKGLLASVAILKSIGFNPDVIDFYYTLRAQWVLYANETAGCHRYLLKIAGEFMQHSGQPYTLDGNTQFNMSSIGMCYEFVNLRFASFKGDDSIILADAITMCFAGTDAIKDLCGFVIKAEFPAIAEYIANIITPDGEFFPDVLRRVSKVAARVYRHNVDWDETLESITESLDVIRDDAAFMRGCKIASEFYHNHNIPITPEEVRYLCYFLSSLRKHKDLSHIKSEKFTYLHIPIASLKPVQQ